MKTSNRGRPYVNTTFPPPHPEKVRKAVPKLYPIEVEHFDHEERRGSGKPPWYIQ